MNGFGFRSGRFVLRRPLRVVAKRLLRDLPVDVGVVSRNPHVVQEWLGRKCGVDVRGESIAAAPRSLRSCFVCTRHDAKTAA